MKKYWFFAWLIVTAVLVAPDFFRFANEYRAIAGLADELAGSTREPHDLARTYSDVVNRRLTIDRNAESYLSKDRPFLRATAMETWTTARGFCGEASRVIVNMLLSQGVPATRINMIGPKFVHTAVAYRVGDEWYLLDSFGAPGDFRAWSEQNTLPVNELVSMTFHSGGGTPIEVNNPYFTRYSFFNWARVLRWAEINQRTPFPMPITLAIENPPLLTGLLKLAGAVVVLLIGWLVLRRRDRRLAATAVVASPTESSRPQ